MSPVNKSDKWIAFSVCSVLIVVFGYHFWHGYFDQGDFRLLSSKQSPTEKFAMVAKRSDHEVLNGGQVFVLLGDHIFSAPELRHAVNSPTVIFSTDRDCLSLQWRGSQDLVISCKGEPIEQGDITRQLTNWGDVTFTYVNIVHIHMTLGPQ
jgi:hypothetical protein